MTVVGGKDTQGTGWKQRKNRGLLTINYRRDDCGLDDGVDNRGEEKF